MTKFLLAAIAIGLWLHLFALYTRPTQAQSSDEVTYYLNSIAHDVHALAKGGADCSNMKICD